MARQKLRVGFDLDGVLLYNPARAARRIIYTAKKILRKDISQFHLPKNKSQQLLWHILHKSSLSVAQGADEIIELIKQGKIEAYIISGRYDLLRDDFGQWVKKMQADKYFSGAFYNNENEQPYLFKERAIKKLNLDIFIEDNWDIVQYLNSKLGARNPKVFWITNILDRGIKYPYKFNNLQEAIDEVKSNL